MTDVTQILSAIEQGDPSRADELLPLVYDELRRLAALKMSHESPDHTLEATALVHEAFVRLVDNGRAKGWDSRRHFFSAAAEAMRRILVEAARRKRNKKAGGDFVRHDVDDFEIAAPALPEEDLLGINEALDQLAANDEIAANLVKFRYFAGFTLVESAELLGISSRKASQIWSYARVWLLDKVRIDDV